MTPNMSRPTPPPLAASTPPASLSDAWRHGADYENSLSDDQRRAGAWYTPLPLAVSLTGWATQFTSTAAPRCIDPACGGGAFLLAAAERLADSGLEPATIIEHHLVGVDVDEKALAATRQALIEWARSKGAQRDPSPVLLLGDALTSPLLDGERFDLVIGNPPFQSQLSGASVANAERRRVLTERFGTGGAYTDTAFWFLAAAWDLLAPGGIALLIQPQSILAARDAGPVRSMIARAGALVGMWWDGEPQFDAAVRVCAPVLRRPSASEPTTVHSSVRRTVGVNAEEQEPVERVASGSWSPLVADLVGLPALRHGVLADPTATRSGRLGDVASVTAGFRDEYYGIVAALIDTDRAAGDHRNPSTTGTPGEGSTVPVLSRQAPVATVGHVDPAVIRWATRPVRLAQRQRIAPMIDLDRLDGRVARWVEQRRHPKILVASQARVIEAAADPDGLYVPLTPLISVEVDDPDDLWRLLAVLLAPPVSVAAVVERLGSGLGNEAVRLRAVDIAEIPLPADGFAWRTAAALLAGRVGDDLRGQMLDEVGRLMCQAYGLRDDETEAVMAWWSARQPRRRDQRR